jgi:hypothetical protein
LRLRVDPVEVLEHQQEGLDLALSQEEPLQGVVRALPALGWVENLPPPVFHRDVEQREERRQRRLEGAIEREELAGDLLPDGTGLRQELHRAPEVGEEHRDLLPLAFEGALRGQDLLGEMARGVGLGGGDTGGGCKP